MALGLAVGSATRVGDPVVTPHSPARAMSAADHAAFIGVVEVRSTRGLADLIGLLGLALFVGAGWALVSSTQAPGLSAAGDGLRRWRARLVGAPRGWPDAAHGDPSARAAGPMRKPIDPKPPSRRSFGVPAVTALHVRGAHR